VVDNRRYRKSFRNFFVGFKKKRRSHVRRVTRTTSPGKIWSGIVIAGAESKTDAKAVAQRNQVVTATSGVSMGQ